MVKLVYKKEGDSTMSEPRQIVQQSVYYQVVDYGHIRVKLAEVLNSRGVTRNRLRKLTGSSYEVVTRYYNADLKRVEMVDLDFMSRVCYALDCTLEDLLEYVPPEKEKAE